MLLRRVLITEGEFDFECKSRFALDIQ